MEVQNGYKVQESYQQLPPGSYITYLHYKLGYIWRPCSNPMGDISLWNQCEQSSLQCNPLLTQVHDAILIAWLEFRLHLLLAQAILFSPIIQLHC